MKNKRTKKEALPTAPFTFIDTLSPTFLESLKLHANTPVEEGLPAPLEYKIKSCRTIEFTQARAEQYLQGHLFEGERKINPARVVELVRLQKAGRFMWDQVTIAYCVNLEDGCVYGINGQHTSLSVIVGHPKPARAIVTEKVYEVPNLSMVRALYASFDRNKPRTTKHAFIVIMGDTPATEGLWSSTIANLRAGFNHWQFPVKSQPISAETLESLISGSHAKLFNLVGKFYQEIKGDSSVAKRGPVMAAMMATFDINMTDSREFWLPVLIGTGLASKTDPRWVLRKYLDTHSIRSVGAGLIPTSAEEMYKVCIQGWNKWRNGEQVIALRAGSARVKPN